jgi:hypothetical protein
MRVVVRTIVIAGMVAVLLVGVAGAVSAGDVKVNLKIPSVYCASKGAAAADAALSVRGVRSAVDDWGNNILTVVFDDTKTDIETIKKALSAADFPAAGHEVLGK